MAIKTPNSELSTLNSNYAYVAVDIPTLTEPLLFKADGLDVYIGDVVAVQIKNSYKAGIVILLSDNLSPVFRKIGEGNEVVIKPVLKVVGKGLLNEEQIKIAEQISKYYCCPLFEALKLFLPAGYSLKLIKKGDSFQFAKPVQKEKSVSVLSLLSEPQKPTLKQSVLIEFIRSKPHWLKKDLIVKSGVTSAVIDNMINKGYISLTKKSIERLPQHNYSEDYGRPQLNEEQAVAYSKISESIKKNMFEVFVLFGVTASGKTEVYLRCIEDCLVLGKTAIFLLPEISLTPQVSSRLRSRFGDKVAILHSAMSTGERFDQYNGVKEGRYKIVVGPRSAVFAPLENIGLIIIDEEQEAGFKQNRTPRYDARKIALLRAKTCNAKVIYGSATPSIETLYRALQGKYKMLTINKRAVGAIAKITLVDLTKEPNKDNCLSRYLRNKIKVLQKDEKSVVLLNRRGFSGFIICRNCGHVPKCPNCDVSLTLHGNYLVCHYCNKITTFKSKCDKCDAMLNKFLAAGTQRVEWEIKRDNDDLSVIRMDADTTKEKSSYGKKLADFKSNNRAVLVGTQMIAKGLDYPNVTVVGAVNTDIGLNIPDFRSNERVFQLIYQLCGRAGRGEMESEVVLQTYDPENQTIRDILKGDYLNFYNHEIERRKELDYPPFSKLINIGIRGKDKEKVKATAKKIAEKINKVNIEEIKNILGPASAPIAYINKEYRWHILLKLDLGFKNYDGICKAANSCHTKNVNIAIDVDPVSML